MLLRVILAASLVFFVACQTSMIRSFDKVQNGMDKHQVLQLLGTPKATTRLHGRDRWLYRFYDDGVRYDKEVHFDDELVVYSGGPWVPPPEKTAVQVDRKHEEAEVIFQAEDEAREKDRQRNAELFREYEMHSHKQDKVEYLPEFVDK